MLKGKYSAGEVVKFQEPEDTGWKGTARIVNFVGSLLDRDSELYEVELLTLRNFKDEDILDTEDSSHLLLGSEILGRIDA